MRIKNRYSFKSSVILQNCWQFSYFEDRLFHCLFRNCSFLSTIIWIFPVYLNFFFFSQKFLTIGHSTRLWTEQSFKTLPTWWKFPLIMTITLLITISPIWLNLSFHQTLSSVLDFRSLPSRSLQNVTKIVKTVLLSFILAGQHRSTV